jgi:hypothetical protein
MGFQLSRRLGSVVLVCAAGAITACQGNIGGGSGLSIPQAPGYGQPAGPNGAQTQSRERVLDGAVFLSSKLTEVPLPELGGFGVTIALGTPGPASAATEAPAAPPTGLHAAFEAGRTRVARAVAGPHTGSSPSPDPSSSASGAASGAPASASTGASAQPSGSASGGTTPAAAASGAPSPKPSRTASPAATTASDHPHIDTKLTIYPDDAPPPPTPIPTGEVQTFVHRAPIVRGYVLVGSDLPLYGLGAVHFTLPLTEVTPKRGFTIALFESGKHRHERLMNYDTDPIVQDGLVYSGQSDPVVLKKGRGYLLMIYGDDEPAAAPVVPAGYPSPGNNPFPVPSGYPQPGYTQVPNNPYATPTPYNPYATPTPYNPYATPTPYNPYATPIPGPFGTPHP